MNKNTSAPTTKPARQLAILEMVRLESIGTQQELVTALHRRGILATQASVSRDIAELGLVKAGGVYRAGLPAAAGAAGADLALRTWARRAAPAGPHLVVVTCETGTAQKVALALDHHQLPDIVGTIAGDDTVFVAVPSAAANRRVVRMIAAWINPS